MRRRNSHNNGWAELLLQYQRSIHICCVRPNVIFTFCQSYFFGKIIHQEDCYYPFSMPLASLKSYIKLFLFYQRCIWLWEMVGTWTKVKIEISIFTRFIEVDHSFNLWFLGITFVTEISPIQSSCETWTHWVVLDKFVFSSLTFAKSR